MRIKQAIRPLDLIGGVALSLSLLGLIYYIFEGYKTSFHSDSAAKVLLAAEVIKTGQFFPDTWHYGNGELWVFAMQLLVIPFLYFFPVGYTAHAFGALLNALILLYLAFEILKSLNFRKSTRLFVVALLATGLSQNGVENLFGQYSYSLNLVITLFYLVLNVKVLAPLNEKRAHNPAFFFGIGITVLLVSLQSVSRSMVYLLIPATLGYLLYYLGQKNISLRKNTVFLLLGANISGLFLGWFIRKLVEAELNIADSLSVGVLLDPSLWKSTVPKSIESVLLLLGTENVGDLTLFSPSGLLMAVRYLAAIGIVIVIVYGLISLGKSKDMGARYVSLFSTSSIAITFLATSMTNMGENRYWQVAISIAFIFGFAAFLESKNGKSWIFTTLTFLVISVNIVSITAFGVFQPSSSSESSPRKLQSFLSSHDLDYGYASYWNASKYTILSESELIIRPVHVLDNSVMPFRWLSSETWFRGSSKDKSFLLLDNLEKEILIEADLEALGVAPKTRLTFGESVIYVFDFDLADRLVGWDPTFLNGDYWPANISTFTKIGVLNDSAQTGNTKQCLSAKKGEFGLVHFGPYVSIAPGTYTAKFEISTSEPTSERTYIAVTYNGGLDTLGKQPLDSTLSVQEIEFKVESFTEGLELIYYSGGESDSLFCGVSLKSK